MSKSTTKKKPAAAKKNSPTKNPPDAAGSMRVWWIPQVPGPRFFTTVSSVGEAMLLIRALGRYDIFQFENRIKPDFCNAGGLEVFDGPTSEWLEWYDDETGDDINEMMRQG